MLNYRKTANYCWNYWKIAKKQGFFFLHKGCVIFLVPTNSNNIFFALFTQWTYLAPSIYFPKITNLRKRNINFVSWTWRIQKTHMQDHLLRLVQRVWCLNLSSLDMISTSYIFGQARILALSLWIYSMGKNNWQWTIHRGKYLTNAPTLGTWTHISYVR